MENVKTTLREANRARQAEWDPGKQITLEYRGNELAGETGEACNIIKKLARERLGIRGSRATVQELADELADVVICADLIALAEGIDLDAAVAAKFNATSAKMGLVTRLAPRRVNLTLALDTGPAADTASALSLIVEERRRQIEEEGFTAERDDGYTDGSLASAGAAYALAAATDPATRRVIDEFGGRGLPNSLCGVWPKSWSLSWFRPKTRREDLVKAGALIIAELERLDRAKVKTNKETP